MLCLMLSLSFVLIILSMVRSVLLPYLNLLGPLLSMSGRSVGQDVSPGKYVLLSTSKSVRKTLKLWDVSGGGGFWKVQLDVRDLGGHLDFTLRARAGSLSKRVVKLLLGLLLLVLYLWVFRSSWVWFVVSIFLLAFMLLKHLMCLPRLFVLSGLLLFERFWSSEMPLANAPAILNLLDVPVGVDPALQIIGSRFGVLRRVLAYYPEEGPRIFRMLDLFSWGAQGHGRVNLLLVSAAELGFAWDGAE